MAVGSPFFAALTTASMMPSRPFSRIASANKVDLGARTLRSAGRVAALAFLEAAQLLGGCFVRGHGLILCCPYNLDEKLTAHSHLERQTSGHERPFVFWHVSPLRSP
jgi:hypothetical protein